METTETEHIRRIHFDQHCLEVGEQPDNPEWLELRTVGAKNIEYFGALNLNLPLNVAMQLGKALIDAATEKGAKP